MHQPARLCLLLLLMALAVALEIPSLRVPKCEWDMEEPDEYPQKNPPIIMYSKSKPSVIVLPTEGEWSEKIISVMGSKHMMISCPGEYNKLKGKKFKSLQHVTVQCIGGTQLKITDVNYSDPNKILDLKYFDCLYEIENSVQKTNDGNPDVVCGDLTDINNIGIQYEIGFQITPDWFHCLIKVCFDKPQQEKTLWTEHILRGGHIEAKDDSNIPSSFNTEEFVSGINKIYLKDSEKKKMQDLKIDTDIIHPPKYKLNRGHLSPKGDFVTNAERKATMYYINVLPEWQVINNGNWKKIENSIREAAAQNGDDVQIITGGFGIQQQLDENDDLVDIILGHNDKVPAPAVFWKVVAVEKSGQTRAVAFVTHNNPYMENSPDHLCDIDVCDNLDWLENLNHYARRKVCKGYTYCCEVADLRETIKTIPMISASPVQLLDSFDW